MKMGFGWNLADPEEWRYALALEPQVTKVPCFVDGDWHSLEAYLPLLVEAGVRPVVDLRTHSHSWFTEHEGDPFAAFAQECAEVVATLGEWCRDWEVWGEAPCRWSANLVFEGGNYTRLLRAMKAVLPPDARLWFGGHGVQGDVLFWQRVEEEGGGAFYAVNNLHCFSHARQWVTVEQQYRMMFAQMRGTETERGEQHALASTEFGWPTHPDGAGVPFASHVVSSVLSLSEAEGARWLDNSLALFYAAGMEDVCFLSLREGNLDNPHWGAHIGLYRNDWTPKPDLEVWRAWRALT